ncbi:hypothetical protein EYF80_014285 [Liparis tanakae]|uniref:Uncharacterized protein n=1 Tax=Liparis tanakae TaxID=230148 RepID=A0A4Z2IEJ5_9TELE|nr:hypothetical protein EYF80_014285 [Liparis tanakae]
MKPSWMTSVYATEYSPPISVYRIATAAEVHTASVEEMSMTTLIVPPVATNTGSCCLRITQSTKNTRYPQDIAYETGNENNSSYGVAIFLLKWVHEDVYIRHPSSADLSDSCQLLSSVSLLPFFSVLSSLSSLFLPLFFLSSSSGGLLRQATMQSRTRWCLSVAPE